VKAGTGKTRKEHARRPNLQQLRDRHWAETVSNHDTLTLAHSDEQGDVFLTQGARETHFWVCGSTGQGKSKFLEYLICRDIDRLHAEIGLPTEEQTACPVLFIDPTPNGEIAYKVLSYCDEIGFDKVILIDPFQSRISQKVPPINLFNFPEFYLSEGIEYLQDAFRVAYEIEDSSRTAIIYDHLKSLFSVIYYAELTAHELQHFTLPLDSDIPDTETHADMRRKIFALARKNLKSYPPHLRKIGLTQIAHLEVGYKNLVSFHKDLSSTARRLNQVTTHPDISQIFSHRTGLKFTDVIGDRWAVIVNVSGLGAMPSRLLATIIMNQYIFAVDRLRRNRNEEGKGWNVPAYIYLDEASTYATDKLISVLDMGRNSGVRLILSHQHPEQLRKRGILDSVKANCLTKVAFHIADDGHRETMIKTMYGGSLNIKDVSYALSNQPIQTAVFKINKASPVVAKVVEQPDATGNVKEFVKSLFDNGCYYTYEEIEKDYANRFEGLQIKDTQSPKPTKKDDRKTSGNASVPRAVQRRRAKSVSEDDEAAQSDGERGSITI